MFSKLFGLYTRNTSKVPIEDTTTEIPWS